MEETETYQPRGYNNTSGQKQPFSAQETRRQSIILGGVKDLPILWVEFGIDALGLTASIITGVQAIIRYSYDLSILARENESHQEF